MADSRQGSLAKSPVFYYMWIKYGRVLVTYMKNLPLNPNGNSAFLAKLKIKRGEKACKISQ